MTPRTTTVAADARAGDPIGLARVLVSTPSVNPILEEGGSGERVIAELCGEWLVDWGFHVRLDEVAPDRFNTIAVLEGEGGRSLLLNGHLDTVGVAGMTIDPFAAELTGGRILGRGACDMKGGVAAILAAASKLAADSKPSGRLVVALTADEEHASLGMQRFVSDPGDLDAAIVCEPTELAVMPANKGFVWLDLSFFGRAAHGSRPDVGIDAIRHCAQYLAGLDGYEVRLRQRAPHPLLGHGSFHAGTIQGGSALSVYPAECHLSIERRTLPGETAAEVVAEFDRMLSSVRRVFPDMKVRLSPGIDRPATEVPEHSELVRALIAAARSEGLEGSIAGMTAWVDAALLNEAGVPAVCFGPGSIAQAHSADEWIEAAQISKAATVLERFARGFLSEKAH